MLKKIVKGLIAGVFLIAGLTVISGDSFTVVNGAESSSQVITVTDILNIKKRIIGDKVFTESEFLKYDLNMDRRITVMDLSRAINIVINDKQVPVVTEPPVTEPPVTEPRVTEPPVTEPPVTEPPVTEPPVTAPPVTSPPVTEPPATLWPSQKHLDVDLVLQDPELPTGCEATALTMLLNHYGFGIDKVSLVDFMPQSSIYYYQGVQYGPNYHEVFPGNPKTSSGYGCYAPCMVTTASNYFKYAGNDEYYLKEITGTDFDYILNYVALDKPVMVWATMYLIAPYQSDSVWVTPDGNSMTWVANEHCLVLTGYDKEKDLVYVNDSMSGKVTYSLSKLRMRYNQMGKFAAVLMKKGETVDVESGMTKPPEASFKVGDVVSYTGKVYYSSFGGTFVTISGEYTISEIVDDQTRPYRIRLGTVGWVSFDDLR